MFENFIEDKIKEVVGMLNVSGNSVKLKDILISDLDYFYKIFLKCEIEFIIYQEFLEKNSNPYFPSNEILEGIYQEIEKINKENAEFPTDKLEFLLNKAVKLRFNFLCRPNYTIKTFIFNNDLTKKYKEFLLKLNYFSDYSSVVNKLKDKIIKNVNRYDHDLISLAEVERIITENNEQLLDEFPVEQFIKEVMPLFDQFAPINTIPIEAIAILFDDLAWSEFKNKVADYYEINQEEYLTLSEFANILGSNLEEIENTQIDNINDPGSSKQENDEGEQDLVETAEEDPQNNEIKNENTYDDIEIDETKELSEFLNDIKSKLGVDDSDLQLEDLNPEEESNNPLKQSYYSFYKKITNIIQD